MIVLFVGKPSRFSSHKQRNKCACVKSRQRKPLDRVRSSQHVVNALILLAALTKQTNKPKSGRLSKKRNHSKKRLSWCHVACTLFVSPYFLFRPHGASGLFSWTNGAPLILLVASSPWTSLSAALRCFFLQFFLVSESSGAKRLVHPYHKKCCSAQAMVSQ